MKRIISFAALAVVFAIAAGTGRSAAARDAQAFIGELGNQAIQVMGPNTPLERRAARFHELFRADFDAPRIAQFVLGPYGRSATPEQKEQFLRVFEDTTVQAYAKRFGDYAGDPFRVTGERREGDETVVTSQVIRRGGAPLMIDWYLVDEGGQPKITDVKIGEISMRVQQRELFSRLMQQSGNRMDIAMIAFRNSEATPQYGSSVR